MVECILVSNRITVLTHTHRQTHLMVTFYIRFYVYLRVVQEPHAEASHIEVRREDLSESL